MQAHQLDLSKKVSNGRRWIVFYALFVICFPIFLIHTLHRQEIEIRIFSFYLFMFPAVFLSAFIFYKSWDKFLLAGAKLNAPSKAESKSFRFFIFILTISLMSFLFVCGSTLLTKLSFDCFYYIKYNDCVLEVTHIKKYGAGAFAAFSHFKSDQGVELIYYLPTLHFKQAERYELLYLPRSGFVLKANHIIK